MFNNKITISKNYLIIISFILLISFAINMTVDDVNAVSIDENDDNDVMYAIDEDKLQNSQNNNLLQATKELNGGTFKDIQNVIHYDVNDGDTIILNGVFTTNEPESHIIVYKNLTFKSTNGATLDAKNTASIFVVESGGSGSSFSNLILKNGNGYYGGAMWIYGKDVTIDKCEFLNNYASAGGGAIYTDYNIDADSDHGKNLLIKNSKFKNNSAKIASGAIGAFGYNTQILNCSFESNSVYDKNGGYVYGGAMQVGKKEFVSKALIKDCKFINNSAISAHNTVFSHGGAACIREGVTYENCLFEGNKADRGGALATHCSGTINNCTFKSNSATEWGGALYNTDDVTSMNLKIINCNFDSNTAAYGGAIRLAGQSINVEKCNFNDNYASIDGGAIFVLSNVFDVLYSNFTHNSAKHNGGAIYTNGVSSHIQRSRFISNVAIADPNVKDDGLGGAIYINGTSDLIKYNVFTYNVARNGSAIYNDKTSKGLEIAANTMSSNQAWVYYLPIEAHDISYGEKEVISATIYGGNNIGDSDNPAVRNCVYNAAPTNNLLFNNEIPVMGATNSGHMYQDSREMHIRIGLTLIHEDGSVPYNVTAVSNYLGHVSETVEVLKPGKYTFIARHVEDGYYKGIINQTTFVVKAESDVKVEKESTYTEYNYQDQVVWTISIVNNGPNEATNVKVTDVLPQGLIYKSHTASTGTYSNGIWNIAKLAKSKSATLKITTLINKTGQITNKASITADEHDWNMSNNLDSQTIFVKSASDLAITKVSNVTSPKYGDLIKWTLTVSNNGPDVAHDVVVTDILPSGLVLKSFNGNYNSGKWYLGTLNVKQSKTLEIVTLVNATGTIKNTASVTGEEYDYNMANNEVSKTITVDNAADLVITKNVNNTSPNYGDLVKWTITVLNKGPDVASNVKVSDILPNGLIYQSYSASVGRYSNGVWNIGNLAKNTLVTLNIISKINKTGTIKNMASVSGAEYDIDKSNNNADASVNVPKASDLQITKNVNNSNPNYGDLIKWTVTVSNNGPDIATNIRISDVLPFGLIIRQVSGNYNSGLWTIDTLGVGESKSFDIVTLVNKTGSIVNMASVKGNQYDYKLDNNNVSKSITIDNAADLVITKSVNNTAPNYGDLVKWTVTVLNKGPDAASGVRVSDILPDGLIYQSSNSSVGRYLNGVWNIDNLAKNTQVILDIICKVNKTGYITNNVNVTGNEYDINKTNNKSSQSIIVPKATDLEIMKTVNDSTPKYHNLVKWTITVKNNGPDNATEVIVNDLLPNGLIIKNTTGNYTENKWHIGFLEAFSSVSIDIITFINKTGLLMTNATVSGHEYDYDRTNNYDNSSIDVSSAADLIITKIISNDNPNYGNTVKWIILVENNGPDKATNVLVNELLSDAFELISSTASKGYYINDIWSIGDLDLGEKVNLEILTKIKKTGNFTNFVNVSCDEYDYNPSNNNANKSIFVKPAVDLEITKNVNNSNPNYNDLVKWIITITNNGPDKANAIEINDILDDNLEFIRYNATKGFYENGLWKFCCLEVGENARLEIITRVLGIGEIKNIAVASANEYDHTPENNNAESYINVASACDLEMIKLLNKSNINYKESVEWTLIVRNNGPSEATGVVVVDSLPDGLTFISARGDGSYSTSGTWYVGNIASGEAKTLNIISRADKTGEFNNVAIVKGNQYDYNSNNNKAERLLIVNPAADLAITKTVSKVSYDVGDLISYSIEILNNGPDVAKNISVNEIMDDSLIFQSFILASGEYDSDNHVWNIKSLDSGEKTVLNVNALSTKEGFLSNKVSLIADTFDYNLNNNHAEVIVEIIKNIMDPKKPYNVCLYSKIDNHGSIKHDFTMISKAGVLMKETGIPIGLLILISLISIAFSNTKILKKR